MGPFAHDFRFPRVLFAILVCLGGSAACNVLIDNREVQLIALDAGREPADAAPDREDASGARDAAAEAGHDPPPSSPEAAVPACAERAMERDTVPCGPCGKGTRPRRRSCEAGGNWSEWSFTGSCDEGPTECEPGDVDELGTVACGPCAAGATTLKRVCHPTDCVWSAPSTDVAACQFAETHCSPGDTKRVSMQPCGACSKGSIVQMQACTEQCEWGEPTTSGCTYLDNTCDPLGPTRYRCKPPRDADTNQAYREPCFAADYGADDDPAALAIRCTYGPDDREPCSQRECPDCY
jgi:hypothetical protein